MIYYLNKEKNWESLNEISDSVKLLKNHLQVEEVVDEEKLAEYIGFGFDVYCFVDSDNRLLFYTDQKEAEKSFQLHKH